MESKEINRMVARQAARGVYLYGHQGHISGLRERLLEEAKATDRFYCTDEEMINLSEREYRRIQGNTLGGYVSAAKRRSSN